MKRLKVFVRLFITQADKKRNDANLYYVKH
jgi:hypothetical protein